MTGEVIRDHTTTYITVSVDNTPNYTARLSLLNQPLNLICGYNTRNKMRWVAITDQRNRPILTQTFLKYGKVCEFNKNAELLGLSFSVTIKPKILSKEFSGSYDYLDWADDFDLYFIGRDMDIERRMKENGRKAYVGN